MVGRAEFVIVRHGKVRLFGCLCLAFGLENLNSFNWCEQGRRISMLKTGFRAKWILH